MIDSLKKNSKGIFLMICSSLFACVGQLLWKMSVSGNISILIIGFAFYAVGAVFMLAAYNFGSLSVLQPMLSLSYVISVILGFAVLGEPITTFKVLGVAVITAGVILIGGGDD